MSVDKFFSGPVEVGVPELRDQVGRKMPGDADSAKQGDFCA